MPAQKRIRCVCGKIYDPVLHAQCPACGAATAFGTPRVSDLGVASPPPPPPDGGQTVPPPLPPLPRPTRGSFSALRPVHWLALSATVLLVLIAAILLTRPRPSGSDNGSASVATEDRNSAPAPTPRTNQSGTASRPRGQWIADATNAADSDGADLAAILAKAADGDTVRVRPGMYAGGLILSRAVRILGDTQPSQGQPTITASGGECITVRVQGATLENLQLLADTRGSAPAVAVGDGGGVELKNCAVQAAVGSGVVAIGSVSVSLNDCTLTAPAGAALDMSGQATAKCADCRFVGNQDAFRFADSAGGSFRACRFESNGGRNGAGSLGVVSGPTTRLAIEGCAFKTNPGGMRVSDGAQVEIHDCTFTDNGVVAAAAGTAPPVGLIAASRGGRVTLAGCTLESNRQGLAAKDGGTLELERCRIAGCGIDAPATTFALGNVPLSAAGTGSTLTVRQSGISDSRADTIDVVWGATLVLEDSEVSNAPSVGLVLGDRAGPPSQATIRRTAFTRNAVGLGVRAASRAEIEGGSFSDNATGLLAMETGTRMTLRNAVVGRNREHGLRVQAGADVTADDCRFEDNGRGAWSGVEKQSAGRATLALNNCRITGSRFFAAGACAGSSLALNGCALEANTGAIYRERSAVVRTTAVAPDSGSGPQTSPPPDGTTENGDGEGSASRRRAAQGSGTTRRRRSAGESSRETGSDIARQIRRWFR